MAEARAAARHPAATRRARVWEGMSEPPPDLHEFVTFDAPDVSDAAAYAAEASTLVGIDGIVRAEQRVAALEARLAGLRTLPRR